MRVQEPRPSQQIGQPAVAAQSVIHAYGRINDETLNGSATIGTSILCAAARVREMNNVGGGSEERGR